MRNRAKCKKCESIIESYHRHDYVSCKCGEISVGGGLEYFKCSANDFNNFIRIDDEGNEIIVSVKDKDTKEQKPLSESNLENQSLNTSKPSREDLLNMLEEMVKSYEALPEYVMLTPITHADYVAGLLLLLSLLRSERSSLS